MRVAASLLLFLLGAGCATKNAKPAVSEAVPATAVIDRAALFPDPCAEPHAKRGSTDGLGRPRPPSTEWSQLMRVMGEPDFAQLPDEDEGIRCIELGLPAYPNRFVRAGKIGDTRYITNGATCRHLSSEEWERAEQRFLVVSEPEAKDNNLRRWDPVDVVVEVARLGMVEVWSAVGPRESHPMMKACAELFALVPPPEPPKPKRVPMPGEGEVGPELGFLAR